MFILTQVPHLLHLHQQPSQVHLQSCLQQSLNHNLSFVHYNVQSILPKIDLFHAELIVFDILAFSETWLHPDIDADNLLLEQHQVPERKDRNADNHGGVTIYIKESIHYKRRADLEVRDLENIWLKSQITTNEYCLDYSIARLMQRLTIFLKLRTQ